jgi:hypothetical protein
MGLSNSSADFAQAHQLGLVAQQAVSGYTFISQANTLNRSLTGNIVGTHQKGNAIVTVTFKVVNGNLSRVTRRP